MKKIFFLIITLCAAAAVVLCVLYTGDKKKTAVNKPDSQKINAMIVTTTSIKRSCVVQGSVVPAKSQDVVFHVGGELESGEMVLRKGMRFRKNQLLFQVNNSGAFTQMLSDKENLRSEISGILPEIEAQFPAEKKKWEVFTASLEPGSLLSPFPDVKTAEEQKLLERKKILQGYHNVKRQEAGMSGFFYLAPFDGIVIEILANAGEKVVKNQIIARIAPNEDFQVKCVVPLKDFSVPDSITQINLLDNENKPIGTGTILKVIHTGNAEEIYLSAGKTKRLPLGSEIHVQFEGFSKKKYFRIPKSAVKLDKVNVLSEGKRRAQLVSIVAERNDSVFVSGLEDGEQVILN